MAVFPLFGSLPVFESEDTLPGDLHTLWRMASHYNHAFENPEYDPKKAVIILRRLIALDTDGEIMEACEALGRLYLKGEGCTADPEQGKRLLYAFYRHAILHEERLYILGEMLTECYRLGIEDYPLLLGAAYARILQDKQDPKADPIGLCLYWHLLRLCTHQLERRVRLLDDPADFFTWMADKYDSADARYHLGNLGDPAMLGAAAHGGCILAIDRMIGPEFRNHKPVGLNKADIWKEERAAQFLRMKENYGNFGPADYDTSTYHAFKSGITLCRKADAEMEQRHLPGLPPESRKISGMNWREHKTAPIEVMQQRFARLKEIEAEYHHPMTWMTMGTYAAYPYYGGVPEDEFLPYLIRAAEHGITLAIVYLGLHYYDHKKDYEKALPWLRIASLRGFSSEVQLSCALSILSLPNRSPDELREAGRWLRLARDNGNPRAAEFLARLHKK